MTQGLLLLVQADGKVRTLTAYAESLPRKYLLKFLRRWVRRDSTPTTYLCVLTLDECRILATVYRSQTHHATRDEIRARVALGGLTVVSHF